MSGPVGSSAWFGTPGFEINQSARFDRTRVGLLQRVPSATGNRRTWTFSCWFKLGDRDDTNQTLYDFGGNYHTYNGAFIRGDRRLQVSDYDGNADRYYISALDILDNSAWYHIVIAFDTTQGTDTDRVKVYLNGTRITMNNTNGHPGQNEDTYANLVSSKMTVGADHLGAAPFEGYLAEVHFLDGAAKAAVDFGETGIFGEWKPIAYSGGSYGTNGFHIDFLGNMGIHAATGGSIATDGDYKVHTFTSNGTFEVTTAPAAGATVEYLLVAGGGAAGRSWNWGGGGGGGGVLSGYLDVSAQEYAVVVGAGGAKGTTANTLGGGGNSTFGGLTAVGGGAGRSGYDGGSPVYQTQTAGGSGGGTIDGPGAGTAGQGFQGGTGTGGSNPHGGGGGGASEAGSTDAIMDGGDGMTNWITGAAVVYGGGGAGSREDNAKGAAGTGGGGSNAAGTNGLGGGAGSAAADTNGGSGVVIIRYRFQ